MAVWRKHYDFEQLDRNWQEAARNDPVVRQVERSMWEPGSNPVAELKIAVCELAKQNRRLLDELTALRQREYTKPMTIQSSGTLGLKGEWSPPKDGDV